MPAVVVSYTVSNLPAKRETSVLVPPTSKPMIGDPSRGSKQVVASPTTPPAGPERIDLSPEKFLRRQEPALAQRQIGTYLEVRQSSVRTHELYREATLSAALES